MSEHEWETGRLSLKDRTKQPVEAMTHALNHPVRLDAITILHQGEFSVGEIAEIMDEDVRYVTGHIRILYKAGCIEYVGLRRIKGHARPVFRSLVLPVITDKTYDEMSKEERHETAVAMAQSFLAETVSSCRERKMDGNEPPVMIWDAPPLDAQARKKLRGRITEFWGEVLDIEAESANRIAESGEEPIPTVVGLFGFERGRAGRPQHSHYRAEKN